MKENKMSPVHAVNLVANNGSAAYGVKSVFFFFQEKSFRNSDIRLRTYLFKLEPLTHCGLVTPYGAIDLGQHWLR